MCNFFLHAFSIFFSHFQFRSLRYSFPVDFAELIVVFFSLWFHFGFFKVLKRGSIFIFMVQLMQ
uniref:Uncharacterized protein n=1 Tax=Cannabis sativa TaxID=3483 RepID=A0A803QVK4_CANSA